MNDSSNETPDLNSIPSAEEASAAPVVPPSTAAPVAADLSPAECAAKLRALFPALFGGRDFKPLKLRIQADIQERAPGLFTKAQLSAFLRRFTGNTGYLIALGRATHRFDLDGQQAGELSEEHRLAAREELARRRGLQQERIELEQTQARNRAGLLHDFERTTLTLSNFCVLKGVTEAELPGLLEIARAERAAQPAQEPRDTQRPRQPQQPRRPQRAGGERDADPRQRGPRGPRPNAGRPAR
ncbi:ProQ/FinO family protein [Roseateles koreensis]|uniref:ProQ/FinO family protein n=1 Tax=Roseateles koreensis TaxID=2987526 RepID=A0ABT5KPS0_9BURK|nr:ProQ/FinO family protein [Roseateles koreensis]MDC8784923.1 ProQ/FinO family protein [Roseateles koreensis]